ncbi:hypothetical protein BGZ81_006585 [Podila clonocystis]|nr:hypothetical protein BGZ81_006585 [Podila clonocystis]
MDSLPEECLDLILQSIPPHRPLHPLLLVSRTFFRLVVPILYQNPFDYIDRVLFSHHNANQRKIMALSLLLLSSPEPLFEGLTLKPGGWPYKNPATVDYLSFYTRHSEKQILNLVSLVVTNSAQTPVVICKDSSPSSSLPSPSSSSSGIMSIKDRVHTGFVVHSASHIQSLCFSMHKFGVLLPLVPLLSALARLELFMSSHMVTMNTGASRFITAHLEHHPGVLREIKIDTSGSSHIGGLFVAAQVEALGPQAQVIDVTGWIDGLLYLDRFPSAECTSLLLRQTVPPRLDMPQGLPQVVKRFGKLERIRFPAVDAGLFAWAVAHEDGLEDLALRPSIPPLASLDLHGPDDHLIPALSDVTNAFRDTMVEIKGLSSFGQSTGRVLEWDWSLPRLTHLDLEGTVAVRFNLLSLQHCPALRVLRLNIGRQIPETWVPAVKARELAECLAQTQVTMLELSGYWDVSDADLIHQKPMLGVLKRLTRLDLMWCRGPTIETFEFLMREMRVLKRLHISGTLAEKERLSKLKETLRMEVSLDIEARG